MSLDRFVWFENEKVPSKTNIGKVLEDYFGAIAQNIYWRDDRWTVLLVGYKSWPFRRVVDVEDPTMRLIAGTFEKESVEDRWIEVIMSEQCIDVLTRHQDEATNRLADGFAKLIARFWKGTQETP
jgi:hypothetical protein